MIVTPSADVSGHSVARTLGLVCGSTIRARHIGKDILAALKNVVEVENRTLMTATPSSSRPMASGVRGLGIEDWGDWGLGDWGLDSGIVDGGFRGSSVMRLVSGSQVEGGRRKLGCRVPAESHQIFLLSPANCGGNRARIVLSERAAFGLAIRLRNGGASLGEVFSFMSGLYFRGKLAYARAFARPPDPASPVSGAGVFVITPNAGLRTADTPVTVAAIQAFAGVDVSADNPAYRRPLERSARTLARDVGGECNVVLLGSIASPKYVGVLEQVFGQRLLFPADFVGRGDMSRGGLLLRSVAAGAELPYIQIAGAVRHGHRPPRLAPLRRTSGDSPIGE